MYRDDVKLETVLGPPRKLTLGSRMSTACYRSQGLKTSLQSLKVLSSLITTAADLHTITMQHKTQRSLQRTTHSENMFDGNNANGLRF